MAQKDRKKRRLRGSRTQGWGNAQKHRGAGSRGGRGMAGSKKHKWVKVVQENPDYFGRSGFTRHKSVVNAVTSINAGVLDERITRLAASGKAEEKSSEYTIDLSSIGVEKLLGSGKVSRKINVTVKKATLRAIEKIKASGGSVEVLEAGEFSGSRGQAEDSGAENVGQEVEDESGVSETGAEVSA